MAAPTKSHHLHVVPPHESLPDLRYRLDRQACALRGFLTLTKDYTSDSSAVIPADLSVLLEPIYLELRNIEDELRAACGPE